MKKAGLNQNQAEKLLGVLKARFEKNLNRHKGVKWADVQKKLLSKQAVLWTLNEMEKTGGEPDVIGVDKKTGAFVFCDCSAQTPAGRVNVCYDKKALDLRKKFKPKNNAADMASDMGIELLTEEEYMALQKLGEFDTKTSSWIKTPDDVRKLGGALFGDRRFGRVFIYHNGAESYYSVRGFRGIIKI
ncbi:MAG: DUF4256 domain-containing protein [Candidatus Goldbacteria bacterium]|nr:DUF4256 domain-containing protein [Candidatus Goldiibacteriota bacterium]